MTIALAITMINMGSFFVSTRILGGDALRGEQKGKQFFVAEGGKLTEVTRAQWIYSLIHAILFLANVPAITFVYFWLRVKGDIRIERLGW